MHAEDEQGVERVARRQELEESGIVAFNKSLGSPPTRRRNATKAVIERLTKYDWPETNPGEGETRIGEAQERKKERERERSKMSKIVKKSETRDEEVKVTSHPTPRDVHAAASGVERRHGH